MSELLRIEREIGTLAAKIRRLRHRRRQLEILAGKNERANSPRTLAIKNAYENGESSVESVAREFSTSAGFVQRLARDLNWKRRLPAQCKAQRVRRDIEAVERA